MTQSYPPDRAVSNLRRARADEVRLIASAFTKLGAQTTAYKSLCKVLYEALHALAQDISSKARREGESRNTIMALEQRCKELESKMQEYSFMHDRAVKMNEEMTSMSGTLALAEGVANRSREEVERLQREVERLQEELSANRMEMSINEVSTSVSGRLKV